MQNIIHTIITMQNFYHYKYKSWAYSESKAVYQFGRLFKVLSDFFCITFSSLQIMTPNI